MARSGLLYGAGLILCGMTLIGLTDNLVRTVSNETGLWQFHLLRSAMALPLLAAGAALFGYGIRPRRPGRVALRAAVQTAAMLLYFGALPMMPIAQVGASLFTAPIWVLIFAALIFGRPIGPRRAAAVALGFLGVLVMLRPDPANLSPFLMMPLAAGALYGLSNLLTRELCADEPVGALLGTFFAGLAIVSAAALVALEAVAPSPAALEAAPFLATGWRAPGPAMLGWMLAQAVGALVGVGLVARGYQSGETASLAVFEYVFLLSAGFWAWALWGEGLAPLDFLGIAMIVGAGVLIALAGGPRRVAAPIRRPGA